MSRFVVSYLGFSKNTHSFCGVSKRGSGFCTSDLNQWYKCSLPGNQHTNLTSKVSRCIFSAMVDRVVGGVAVVDNLVPGRLDLVTEHIMAKDWECGEAIVHLSSADKNGDSYELELRAGFNDSREERWMVYQRNGKGNVNKLPPIRPSDIASWLAMINAAMFEGMKTEEVRDAVAKASKIVEAPNLIVSELALARELGKKKYAIYGGQLYDAHD